MSSFHFRLQNYFDLFDRVLAIDEWSFKMNFVFSTLLFLTYFLTNLSVFWVDNKFVSYWSFAKRFSFFQNYYSQGYGQLINFVPVHQINNSTFLLYLIILKQPAVESK